MDNKNVSTKDLQFRIIKNKRLQDFGTDAVNNEILILHSDVAEAWNRFSKNLGGINEKLVDAAMQLLCISEMSGIDLGKEIISKMKINEKRVYLNADGTVNENFDPEYLPHMADYFMDGMK